MREINYLKAVVIVHGKSEKQICDFVKQQLRMKMQVVSEKKGEKSIQITSLKNILNNKIYKNKQNFIREYPDIELDSQRKNISPEFRIFIIMDTDDCTEKQKQEFISKKMFEGHWAYEYIVPIFNSPQLESVLVKANVPFEKKDNKRKKEYIKIFPTDEKYIKSDVIQIDELREKLKKIKETNMDEFLEFCLKNSK